MTEGPVESSKRKGGRLWAFAPLGAFALLGAILGYQLFNSSGGVLPSALLDRPAPEFELPSLRAEDPAPVTGDELAQGRVSVVNLWASWCAPCRIEHPELMRLAELDVAQMVGVAYNDDPDDSRRFLRELGDPFDRVGVDRDGLTALSWGVEGVPETFIVGGDGRILYKHTGPIAPETLEDVILPIIREAAAR